MNRLEEIRQRLDAATPGPWRRAEPEGCTTDHGWGHHPCKDVVAGEEDVISSIGHDADAVVAEDCDINLIAHAPEDIALLLEVVDAANALLSDDGDPDGYDDPALRDALARALGKLDVEIPE